MFSIFQELDAAANLYEKGKRFYNKKYLYRKYKDFPYFFANYNKKTYINKNGDGIVFMSCDIVVLDKAKTKYIKAKLDITDAKDSTTFPTFHYMQLPNKEPFKDYYFKVWANDNLITSVTEDYYILPEKDRSEWKRSNKKIALKINLNSNMLEENKIYVSIDDFGTGYSSLNLLREMPLDVLKLDKEFFGAYDENTGREQKIIHHIISMAKDLEITVLAEGVETERQKEFLKESHCDMIQGYYYAKPMPMDKFTTYINQLSA